MFSISMDQSLEIKVYLLITVIFQQQKQYQIEHMSLKDFIIMQKLGEGSYAKVYKARRLADQKIYALKQIHITKLNEKAKQNALNQVRFLASFNNKNIIKYYEAFFQQSQNLLCIVMEYATGGDLGSAIQAKKKNKQYFYEIQIWKLLICLIHGIGYLHDNSILHRDIKPQNIFIANQFYKVGDLNVSRLQQQVEQKLTQIGTPYYASPQIWQNSQYDNKCDVWSMGCVLHHMATLNPPFLAKSMDQLYMEITTGTVRNIPQHYSNQLSNIIRRCLEKQPSKRPTIKQLQQNFTVKMYENLYFTSQQIDQEKYHLHSALLKTITFQHGKSMKHVQLPQPNYDSWKQKEQSQSKQNKCLDIKSNDIIKIQKSIKSDEVPLKEEILNSQIKQHQQLKKYIVQKEGKQNQIVLNNVKEKVKDFKPINYNQKLTIVNPLDSQVLAKLIVDKNRLRHKSEVEPSKNDYKNMFTHPNRIEPKIINKMLTQRNQNQCRKQSYDLLSHDEQKCKKQLLKQDNSQKQLNDSSKKENKSKSRRSSPRTELSAKKLQTINQCAQHQSQQALMKKIRQPAKQNLFQGKKSNYNDYKRMLMSKLPSSIMVNSVNQIFKENKLARRNIIQDIISQQKANSAKKDRKIDPSVKNMINKNNTQERKSRPKIFTNNFQKQLFKE